MTYHNYFSKLINRMGILSCIGLFFIQVLSEEKVVFEDVRNDVIGDKYSRFKGGAPVLYLSQSPDGDKGCKNDYVEQIHLTIGDDDGSIMVSYASFVKILRPRVYYKYGIETKKVISDVTAYSSLLSIGSTFLYNPNMGAPFTTYSDIIHRENTANWAYDKITGEKYAQWANISTWHQAIKSGLLSSKNPYSIYDSPYLYTAKLLGIPTGSKFVYQIVGSCKIFESKVPGVSISGSVYPFKIGLMADLGITTSSRASVTAIKAMKPDIVLLVGDLSYADGWVPIWDTFGRMMQDVFAVIPLLTTGGNHEMGSSENWMHYNIRWPTPHKRSQSPAAAYYGQEIGPVHFIALNSYAGTHNTSIQYDWLDWYLSSRVDRNRTPWLIIFFHTPWYNSNSGHWRESELMRQDMESLLYEAGVDLIVSGHVHSYERTKPIYNGEVDPCGPVHLVVGDAGNYEGSYIPWRKAETWTAFREASFGVAELVVLNETMAKLSWHRHSCGSASPATQHMNFSDACVTPGDNSEQKMLTVDTSFVLRPDSSICRNRHAGFMSTPTDVNNPSLSPVSNSVRVPPPWRRNRRYSPIFEEEVDITL